MRNVKGVAAGFFAALLTIVVLEAVLALVIVYKYGPYEPGNTSLSNGDPYTVAIIFGALAFPFFVAIAVAVAWLTYRWVTRTAKADD